MVRPGILILVVFLLSGCAGIPGGETSLEDMKKASDVSQCIKVPDGPCGCEMGGSSTAINEKYEQEYMNRIGNQTDGMVACPAVYQCYRSTIKLVNGSCTLEVNRSALDTGVKQ